MAGQMSLFDLVSDEDKKDFEIRMPDVEEYDPRKWYLPLKRKFWGFI